MLEKNLLFKKIKAFCLLVKIEHSVFALPFAYIGLFWSAKGWPGWKSFLFLTLAMVSVRSFAMVANRLADLKFDAKNPRTQDRPLVSGKISVKEGYLYLGGAALIFILACLGLNKLCFYLSFPALIWSAGYSFSKRFTWFCHFILGSVLGLAPIAGWIAYKPEFALPPVLLGLGVMFWVAGFDILYSLQDIQFDQQEKLFSVPACFGLEAGFGFAMLSHFIAFLFFLLAGYAFSSGYIYFLGLLLVGIVLSIEHKIISPKDLSKINLAFFTLNGFIAIFLFLIVLFDLYVGV